MSITQDPIELTRRLVAIESPTGAEGPAVDVMDRLLQAAGWRTTRQPVSPGREDLYAWREPPLLVFSTHLDTVPPYIPLREDAERLYGRGTCDAKGIAAAMTAAAERLAAGGERRIGLLFLVGEETGSDGARAAASLEPRGRIIVNGEPTENRLVIGSKGNLQVRLTARGRAAHSAYPEEGRSAVELLLDALAAIRAIPLAQDPLLGPGTLNIGIIEGGVAANVLAPSASALMMFRTVEDAAPLRRAVTAALPAGVDATFPGEVPPLTAEPLDGWESTVVSYASDLPFLAGPWGRGYMMGPGTIKVAHTDDEQIEKAELLEAVDRYVELATRLIGEES